MNIFLIDDLEMDENATLAKAAKAIFNEEAKRGKIRVTLYLDSRVKTFYEVLAEVALSDSGRANVIIEKILIDNARDFAKLRKLTDGIKKG